MTWKIGSIVCYKENRYGFRNRLEPFQCFYGRIVEIIPPNEIINIDKFMQYTGKQPSISMMNRVSQSPFERLVLQTQDEIPNQQEAKYELVTLVPDYLLAGTQEVTVLQQPSENTNYWLGMREF